MWFYDENKYYYYINPSFLQIEVYQTRYNSTSNEEAKDYLTLENCSIDDFDGNSENDLAFSLKNSNDIYLDVTELM